jgi:DNA-binding NarL/FixJ family response regulator
MSDNTTEQPRKILIASSHPLFGRGLQSLFKERWSSAVEIVGFVTNVAEAKIALREHKPDILIVDHDDDSVNRDEFIAQFVESKAKMRLVLLSLSEGNEAIVYDRTTHEASEIQDWLTVDTSIDQSTVTGDMA